MAKKDFSAIEQKLKSIFRVGDSFIYKEIIHKIIQSEKPTSSKGEPKTDLFVKTSVGNKIDEFKISLKKENADFLENKIKLERAKEIFGKDIQEILIKHTNKLKENFYKKKLIGFRGGDQNITLGWRFELVNKGNGALSDLMILTNNQKVNVFSGTTLSDDKKNAFIGKERIDNSGIAQHILVIKKDMESYDLQNYVDNLEPIEQYAKDTDIYFAFKASNYQVNKDKVEGDRDLVVWLDWKEINGYLRVD